MIGFVAIIAAVYCGLSGRFALALAFFLIAMLDKS